MAAVQRSPSSPVAALREQFGDRKPPEITRKITACVACRKQKIKCHMRDGRPPCTRCKKRGLPCTVNKSLQMILESDADWKHSMEFKVKRLETMLAKVGGRLDMPELVIDEDDAGEDGEQGSAAPYHDATAAQTEFTPAQGTPSSENQQLHHWEIIMDPHTGPGTIPGSSLVEVDASPQMRGKRQSVAVDDLVTRGIITLDEAQSYLDIFQNRLNHFLYSIVPERKTLAQVRQSPLLFSAICAVGALHKPSAIFDRCYQEFVTLAGQTSFAQQNTTDDVRALCIGAFWLSGISWKCVAAAVRIATELQLQRSIYRALANDRSHYLRTRLYYLVYVCDHHFSVPYGRPPMTCTDESIKASMKFLESEHAAKIQDDSRLVSQVQLWMVGSDAFTDLGIDVDHPLDATKLGVLRRISIRLDNIRADWTEAFSHNDFVGNYPKKGLGLHYHFSKLYLYSRAFWGIGKPGFMAGEIATEIEELANSAMLSAMAILRSIAQDPEIQGYLNGLPTYFDLMIAFAAVFVLKVCTKYSSYVRVDTRDVRTLVSDNVAILKQVTSSMHLRHILASVSHGIETLLNKCFPSEDDMVLNSSGALAAPANQLTFDQNLQDLSMDFASGRYDNFYMSDFDFLSMQEPMYFEADYSNGVQLPMPRMG